MIHILVAIQVKPDRRGEFGELADYHSSYSAAERGCVRFEVWRNGDHALIWETFKDEAAVAFHRATPHYRRWCEEIGDLQQTQRIHAEFGTIITPPRLTDLASLLRFAGVRLVWTNGVYDLLGVHHVRQLQEAREQGDALIVGVNGDGCALDTKGKLPVRPVRERAEMLAALRHVDFVVPFWSEAELIERIADVRPGVLAKGADRCGEEIPGAEHAGRIHFCQYHAGHSTTRTLERIRR